MSGVRASRARVLASRLSIALVLAMSASAVPGVIAHASTSGARGIQSATGKLPLPADCQDVLVLGARGSGQPLNGTDDGDTGMGPEVYQAYLAIVDELPPGTSAAPYGIPYVALPIDAGNLDNLILGRFFKGLESGVRMVQGTLRARAAKCEQERIVLVGFSQGGAVMHRVLQRALPKGMRDRITGAVLIADPDRRPSSTPVEYGSAPSRSQGLATWVWHFGIASKSTKSAICGPGRVPCANVHSVCTDDDPFCDFFDPGNPVDQLGKRDLFLTGVWILGRIHIHEGYLDRSEMFDAASTLGAQVSEQLTGADARYDACLDQNEDRFEFEDDLYAYCNGVVYGTIG